jgi:hypothetical protein
MSVDKVEQHTRELERTLKHKIAEEYQLKGMIKEINNVAKKCSNEYNDLEGLCVDRKMELTREVNASLSSIESYKNLLNNLEVDSKNANEVMQLVLAKRASLKANKLAAKIIVCQYIESMKKHVPIYLEAHKLIRNSVHY